LRLLRRLRLRHLTRARRRVRQHCPHVFLTLTSALALTPPPRPTSERRSDGGFGRHPTSSQQRSSRASDSRLDRISSSCPILSRLPTPAASIASRRQPSPRTSATPARRGDRAALADMLRRRDGRCFQVADDQTGDGAGARDWLHIGVVGAGGCAGRSGVGGCGGRVAHAAAVLRRLRQHRQGAPPP